MRIHRLPLVVVAIALLGLLPGPARAAGAVSMKASKFDPKEVQVKAGESVTWTNADSLQHSVTADDGSFDSSPQCGQPAGTCVEKGKTYSHAFPAAGRFAYYCRIHGAAGG